MSLQHVLQFRESFKFLPVHRNSLQKGSLSSMSEHSAILSL